MVETLSLETIDVGALQSMEMQERLESASRDCGLFRLENHGVDGRVLGLLDEQSRHFFAQPAAAKRASLRTLDNPWGYNDAELTKNTRDWKEIFDHGFDGQVGRDTPWPEGQPEFREAVLSAYAAFESLSLTLVSGFERLFGTAAGTLGAVFEPAHSSFIRLNYYRPCPEPASPASVEIPQRGHLGVNHHTDSGVLTILLLDGNDGLEVFHDDQWRSVSSEPGSLVVNLGDVMQVWSNDAFAAPLHRVRASFEGDRLSVPFFLNPGYDASYAPLPEWLAGGEAPRYRAIPWAEFRERRLEGDYADLGGEVQISDYAIEQATS